MLDESALPPAIPRHRPLPRAAILEKSFLEILLLFGAGLAAGAVNSLAGGGSFIAFPALLLAGVPPIMANATNTFAALPGYISGSIGYWSHIWQNRHLLPPASPISFQPRCSTAQSSSMAQL